MSLLPKDAEPGSLYLPFLFARTGRRSTLNVLLIFESVGTAEAIFMLVIVGIIVATAYYFLHKVK